MQKDCRNNPCHGGRMSPAALVHPARHLLPMGEGIAPIIELRDFMSSMSLIRLGVHRIRDLPRITIMLTGQQ